MRQSILQHSYIIPSPDITPFRGTDDAVILLGRKVLLHYLILLLLYSQRRKLELELQVQMIRLSKLTSIIFHLIHILFWVAHLAICKWDALRFAAQQHCQSLRRRMMLVQTTKLHSNYKMHIHEILYNTTSPHGPKVSEDSLVVK